MLTTITELSCTWTLLHNKHHGAAIVNPSTDFVLIDSQAKKAFQLAPGASWESVSESTSENPSKWSRLDNEAVVLNERKF
jgi:hypothetical protein